MIFFRKIIWYISQKHLPLHTQSRNDSADDSLAQQVEHNTFNVGVMGSSPMRVTDLQEKRVCHKSVTHPFFVCVSIYSS